MNFLKLIYFSLRGWKSICGFQNPLPVVKRAMPLNSFNSTNFPTEGIYQIKGYIDESTPEHPSISVFGKLLLKTNLEYPDCNTQLYLVCCILNKENSFVRDPEKGFWKFGAYEKK